MIFNPSEVTVVVVDAPKSFIAIGIDVNDRDVRLVHVHGVFNGSEIDIKHVHFEPSIPNLSDAVFHLINAKNANPTTCIVVDARYLGELLYMELSRAGVEPVRFSGYPEYNRERYASGAAAVITRSLMTSSSKMDAVYGPLVQLNSRGLMSTVPEWERYARALAIGLSEIYRHTEQDIQPAYDVNE